MTGAANHSLLQGPTGLGAAAAAAGHNPLQQQLGQPSNDLVESILAGPSASNSFYSQTGTPGLPAMGPTSAAAAGGMLDMKPTIQQLHSDAALGVRLPMNGAVGSEFDASLQQHLNAAAASGPDRLGMFV